MSLFKKLSLFFSLLFFFSFIASAFAPDQTIAAKTCSKLKSTYKAYYCNDGPFYTNDCNSAKVNAHNKCNAAIKHDGSETCKTFSDCFPSDVNYIPDEIQGDCQVNQVKYAKEEANFKWTCQDSQECGSTAGQCININPRTTTLSVHVRYDSNNNKEFNYPDDKCFEGRVGLKLNNTVLAPYDNPNNCIKVFNKSRTSPYNLGLSSPTTTIQYIKVIDSNGAKTYKIRLGEGVPVVPGNAPSSVIFGLKPPPAPTLTPKPDKSKTFKFTGYAFLDADNDGIKDSGEKCYKGNYTVQADSRISDTNIGKEDCSVKYALERKTTANKVNVRMIVPSNYKATKLSYLLQSNPQPRTGDGNSITLSENASVYFGIKPNTSTARYYMYFHSFMDNNGNSKFDGTSETCKAGTKAKITQGGVVKTTLITKCPMTESNVYESESTAAMVNFTAPDTYKITGLWLKDKTRTSLTELPNAESAYLRENATVYIGLKQMNNTTERCSGDTQCRNRNANKPVCKNAGSDTSTCVACTQDKKGACSANQKCVNNKCEEDRGPSPTSRPNRTCDKNAPSLEVTPGNRNGNPGDEKTFDVKVINNDRGGACDPVTFVLSKEHLPSDRWTGKFDDNSLNNIPKAGGSKPTKFHVKSPANATSGVKPITLGVRRQSQTQAQVKTNITYTVGESSLSPTPTRGPTPTPRPSPGPDKITIDLEIGIDGIGTTTRIPLGGNKNPGKKDRALDFHLYSTTDNSHTFSWQESVTYDETLERFKALMTLPKPDKTDIADGTYNFYVSGEPFLINQYSGSINLKMGQTTTLKSEDFSLITGNITNSGDSDNSIDQLDYHILLSCSIYSQDEETCDKDPNYKENSDLNDDGIVNEDDFTLWLKEVGNQEGVTLPDEPSTSPTPTPTACNRVTPEMTITQDKTFVLPGGGTITYTVKVKNVDEGPCEERNMNLTITLPNNNWTGSWDPNKDIKNFKKGQTRTKTLAVTSPNQAPAKKYKVKINLRNNSDEVVKTQEVNFVIRK